jgi:hypothetical protein
VWEALEGDQGFFSVGSLMGVAVSLTHARQWSGQIPGRNLQQLILRQCCALIRVVTRMMIVLEYAVANVSCQVLAKFASPKRQTERPAGSMVFTSKRLYSRPDLHNSVVATQ